MTYINNSIMLIEEEVAGTMSNKRNNKIQDKDIWKSLRTHILSRREKNKQAEADAEVLRKKKCVEYQKMQENKLSLAQINGRLSQLRDKRNELEEEKRALLNQTHTNDSRATALVVTKTEPNGEPVNNKLVVPNNINNAVVTNHRSNTLHQQQHIFRPQSTVNAQSGTGSSAAGSGLSPLAQQSLMMHNSNTSNSGGSHQTLLVCSPSTISDVAAINQNHNVTRSTMSSSASLNSTMTYTKFSSLYSNSSTHLLAPNIGTSNKIGRTPSPQPQSIQQQNYQQQQIVVPYPGYKSMNSSGSSSNNLNSANSIPVINNLNQSLSTGTNSNYPIDNVNRRREDPPLTYNRNIWINNNNSIKNTQPNVSNYGSFYHPNSTTAVNYCVNNGMSSSTTSLSTVNTVYSYSGPPPPPLSRTESTNSGNLMVSVTSEHGQLSKPVTSHQQHNVHHRALSHPPMYMSPGIRNQTSNHHTYHPKPPHGIYSDDKLVSPVPNFYQQQGNRNIHPSNTSTVPSQPHHMSQKQHNIGYQMRHPAVPSSASQISPSIIQSSQQHASYAGPTSSITRYSNKSPATIVSNADISRYQQPLKTPMSRHE